MLASAGNADANNANASHYPSDSSHANVLSVAATNSRDLISGFSQWGSASVHLAAPGEAVLTTANNSTYAVVSGTSFSSPHAAGIAALVAESTGATDYRQIKAHLLNGTVNGRDAFGALVPGQDVEAVPGRVTTGRLDGARALADPVGGVLIIAGININDTASGNGNGVLDPGETALLDVTLSNVWTTELGVAGTLSVPNNTALVVHNATPVMFGNIVENAQTTSPFSVTLADTVTGNEQFFLQLDLTSTTSGTLPSRYFYVEVGCSSQKLCTQRPYPIGPRTRLGEVIVFWYRKTLSIWVWR